MGSPDYSGVLKKQCGTFRGLKTERYFELYGCCLTYFRDCVNCGKGKPDGVLNLDQSFCEDEGDHRFSLSGPQLKRKYVFEAPTLKEKVAWVHKLQCVLEEYRDSISRSKSSILYSRHATSTVALNDFEALAVIGRGAFGKVMKVRKKDTNEIFAMKTLCKNVIEERNLIEHTIAEKSILEKLQHPFIVGLHYAFQTSRKLHLVLDFLSGGELFYHMQNTGRLGEDRARFYTAEIGLALGHIHSHNIIYRDLKPENVVLDKDGHVCLTDFGLAKTNVRGCSAKTFCGTPEYLAPEFLTATAHGKEVDWWSLGVLLYEMLHGLPPLYSENVCDMYELILHKNLEFSSDCSPEAEDLCRKLLERDPTKRLNDMKTFSCQPFFLSLDFEMLLRREIKPPFVPDHSQLNFDRQFTTTSPRFSFCPRDACSSGIKYAGFSIAGESSGTHSKH